MWKQGSNDLRSGDVRSDATVVGRVFLAGSGCMGQCASTHDLHAMECPREIRAVWRALLFPFEERADGPQGVGSFWPSIPVETVKACALIGLHMMAEENSWRSDSGSSVSSSSSSENNMGNGALFVVGLHGSGDTIALFLQDWEVAKVALSCHTALDM